MKKFIYLAVTTLCAFSATASSLQGQMDKGYDLPYLWDSYAGYTNENWMSALADNTRLSEISIPGTHNSMSEHGGDVPKTQTLDVADQLTMGVRYLDARFKYRDNDLYAYHGIISQYQTFDQFLYKVSQFLDSNPSETVLIRMQNEAGAADKQNEFYKKFTEVVNKYRHNYVVPASDNPSLGDVRGKFVFIRDFNVMGNKIGIERARLFIQDEYHLVTNWDLHQKWEAVKKHFNAIDGSRISLNYLSGSVGSFPYFVASGKSSPQSHAPQLWTGISTTNRNKYPDFPRRDCLGALCSIYYAGTNQLTNSWIEAGKLPNNLGVVVMDFPGGGLVDNIIQSNSRLVSSGSISTGSSPAINNINAVMLYEHNNQQGMALPIAFDVPTLDGMNLRMSSWHIPTGWEVRFFTGENYTGDYYTRRAGKANADGFNDKVRSVKVLKRPSNCSKDTALIIYEHSNQQGASFCLNSDLASFSVLNNKLSSWSIPSGWQVRFYEDFNYQGGYYTRNGGQGNASGFNDKISSVQILKK